MDRATSIPDLLDQAIQLCRRQIRPLLSILLVLHVINLAFGRLVQSLLDPTAASVPGWLLPSALGDLPGVLLAKPAGPRISFGLMLLDLLILQTCCHTLLIPLFAQHMLATRPRQQLSARRMRTFVQLLIPAGVLLGLTGLGSLLVVAIVPKDLIFVLLMPARLGATVAALCTA